MNDHKAQIIARYLPGDRVIIDTTGGGEPTNYGHVVGARHGCFPECTVFCRLITINVEGSIPRHGVTIVMQPGPVKYHVHDIEHAD